MRERLLKWAEVIARLTLGLVFGYAGVLKISDPHAFADSIYSFSLLPATAINPVALGLPVLELALGILLLLGFRRRACAYLSTALSMVFVIALAQALIRGLPVDCGCFGSSAPSVAKTLWAIVRDVVLVALALFVAHGTKASTCVK